MRLRSFNHKKLMLLYSVPYLVSACTDRGTRGNPLYSGELECDVWFEPAANIFCQVMEEVCY